MKPNMGTADRTVRLIVALVIALLYATGRLGGTAAVVLGIVALVFLATSLAGRCPLYLPFGISTRKTG